MQQEDVHLFVCWVWRTPVFIRAVVFFVDAAATAAGCLCVLVIAVVPCVYGAASACEEGPATCSWDVPHVKALHGSPHIHAGAAASGCTAGCTKVRGERGKHHVTRIVRWCILLEFFANELEEGRRGYEHTGCQVEDVKRRLGAKREEAKVM
jgi:hypothetical protein